MNENKKSNHRYKKHNNNNRSRSITDEYVDVTVVVVVVVVVAAVVMEALGRVQLISTIIFYSSSAVSEAYYCAAHTSICDKK